ncbi:MAG: lipoprotein signal peptidase [Rikenellaceae bacterium]
MANKRRTEKIRTLIFILILIIIDQLTKVFVKTGMSLGEAIYVFGDWFQIRFLENRGAAYGMELGGEYGKIILSLFRIVAVIALSFYVSLLIDKRTPRKVLFAFSLIVAGATGNIIDSLFYGMIFTESTPYQVAEFVNWGEGYTTFLHGNVVDMLYFPIINTTLPDWLPFWGGEPYIFFSPIFNVADSYITIGAIFLILFCRNHFK